METVKDLLESKGYGVVSLGPEATVLEALQLMAEKNTGAVVILKADKTPVGIFSERDYARKTLDCGKTCKELPVKELMTRKIICVHPTRTVEECMALMTNKRVRHLPVLEGNHVIGLVSIGDIVKALIKEKEFLIDQLEHYISSSI